MSMTLRDKAIFDASLSGKLWGKVWKMAELDMEGMQLQHHLTLHPAPGQTPEEHVCAELTRKWCDATKDSYVMPKPLTPSAPKVGMKLAERYKAELLRWFHARPDAEGYTPISLGSSPYLRAEWRHRQLTAPGNQAYYVFAKSFEAELCIPCGYRPPVEYKY